MSLQMMKLPDLYSILDEAFEIFGDKSEYLVAAPQYRAAANTAMGWKNVRNRTTHKFPRKKRGSKMGRRKIRRAPKNTSCAASCMRALRLSLVH